MAPGSLLGKSLVHAMQTQIPENIDPVFTFIMYSFAQQVHAMHAPAHAPHSARRLRGVRVHCVPRPHGLLHDARRTRAIQRVAAESEEVKVVQEGAVAADCEWAGHRKDVEK